MIFKICVISILASDFPVFSYFDVFHLFQNSGKNSVVPQIGLTIQFKLSYRQMTILSFNISVYNFLSSQIFDSISELSENSVACNFWNYFFVFNKIKKIGPRMIVHNHKKPVTIYIHIIDCLLMNSKF